MQINVLDYLEETVRKHATKTAIIDEHRSVTFLELQNNAKKIAAQIQAKTTNTDSPIAVFLPKSVTAIEAFLGVLYTENFYVPLDIHNPLSRIESIVKNINIKHIITNYKFAPLLKDLSISSALLLVEDIDFEKNTSFFFKENKSCIDMSPAYLINTSGSTGTPKGVLVSHKSVIDYIDWAIDTFNLDENINIGNQAPFVFDNSVLDIYLMLATGSTLSIIPENLFLFPIRLIEYLEANLIDFIFWVPAIMANVTKSDTLKDRNLELRYILFAGEVMPTKVMNHWKSHCKKAVFANLYGPTEITVDCTCFIVDRNFDDNQPLPIGTPCKNTNVLLLNETDELITEPGISGELCVKGTSLALGYYNDPEKTASAFTQNPLNPHYPERIYRTGDIAHYNERGELMYKGRKDFQIKHMGYRIELGEIETAILSITGIDSACVLYNQENKNIVLIYESEIQLTRKDIVLQLHQKLPKYMIPTECILVEKMPLNINGKIDRKKLTDTHGRI